MATGGGRRSPQKYPEELRERWERMVFDIRKDIRLDDAVLDRIDAIVPLGTDIILAEAGYRAPAFADAGARRRQRVSA